MTRPYDVAIVGGGHNGLVCGAYLARAGLRVIILERRAVLGGSCVTEELWPGFKVSTASYVQSLFQPKIIEDLRLTERGFEMIPTEYMFVPFPDGRYLTFWGDLNRTCGEIAKFSKKDAETFPEFDGFRKEIAGFIRELLWVTPPDPSARRWRDLKAMFQMGMKARKFGRKILKFFDVMTMSISDFLDEWFESDQLKAVLSQSGSTGTFGGPKTPGSAYVVVHHYLGQGKGARGWGFVKGGMGSLSLSIARAAQEYGATIRTNADVNQVVVAGSRAAGVVLKTGEEIRARVVASNAEPKRTLLSLVDPKELDPAFTAELRRFRTFSTAFKINFALDEPLRYTAFDPAVMGSPYAYYVHIGPSIEYLERAYDDAKYGRPSERPFLSPVLPSLLDPTLTPEGKHVLSVFGGHAPYALKGSSWDKERDAFADRVVDTIAEYAPNMKQAIIGRQVLMPPDLEEIFGLTEGHIFHGEITPDQLFFMRPVPGHADYRTPIRGLYLCGSGTHPGGGVTGVPGHNAAREILSDWKRGKLR